jgi:hypothetical protein
MKTQHKFKPGRHVWVRPARFIGKQEGYLEILHRFTPDEPFEVTTQITINGAPHYLLLAPDGAEWQVSQLELSSVPLRIDEKKHDVRLGAPVRG